MSSRIGTACALVTIFTACASQTGDGDLVGPGVDHELHTNGPRVCPSPPSMTPDAIGNAGGTNDGDDPCDWFISDFDASGYQYGDRYEAYVDSPTPQGISIASQNNCEASWMRAQAWAYHPAYYMVGAGGAIVWHAAAWEQVGAVRTEYGHWSSSTSKCSFPNWYLHCGVGVSTLCTVGFQTPTNYTVVRLMAQTKLYASRGPTTGTVHFAKGHQF